MLNASERDFVALTDVRIVPLDGGTELRCDFLALARARSSSRCRSASSAEPPPQAHGGAEHYGEGGIRTLGRGFPRHAISSRARSAAPAPLRGRGALEGYATRYAAHMLAVGQAFSKTFGLLVTFGGIGVVVNVLIGYIAFQIRGEREQNERYLEERQQRFGR